MRRPPRRRRCRWSVVARGAVHVREQDARSRANHRDAGTRQEVGDFRPCSSHESQRHVRDAVEPNVHPRVRGIDHLAIADIDPDVLDGLWSRPEEDQITRIKRCSGGQVRAYVVLVLGDTRQADPRLGVDPLDEAGAIESNPRLLAAPHIRRAQVSLGVGHDDGAERRPRARSLRPRQFCAACTLLLIRARRRRAQGIRRRRSGCNQRWLWRGGPACRHHPHRAAEQPSRGHRSGRRETRVGRRPEPRFRRPGTWRARIASALRLLRSWSPR